MLLCEDSGSFGFEMRFLVRDLVENDFGWVEGRLGRFWGLSRKPLENSEFLEVCGVVTK